MFVAKSKDTNTGLLQAEYLYELDRLGNRQVVTETMCLPDGTGPEQQSIAYDYDPLYRMTEAAYTGVLSGTYTYQYDAVGNRIYHSNNVTTTETISYTYDAANRLLESVDLTTSEVTTYDWDDASRLITTTVGSNVTRVYQYSQDGDLLRAEVDGLVTTFAYDGNGQRLQLSIAGETTTFLPDYYGRSNRVLFEQGPEETKQYLYGVACLGEYVTDNATSDTEWRYYQRDGATLVRQTTNQTATITLAWTFSPEGGVVLGEEGPVTHLGCQDDAVYDWSTGLIFKGGRYFDPSLGIWLVGPALIVWSTWRPRKRRKGRKGNGNRGQVFVWLFVLLLVAIPLTGCQQQPPEETPTPEEEDTCTPEPTSTPGLPPDPESESTPELGEESTPTETSTPAPPPTQQPPPTSTPQLPIPTLPPYPLLPAAPPVDRPLDIYGQAAWNGLIGIQAEKNAWWGRELDAREAMVIFINHEFGNLYGADNIAPSGLPPATISATANRYDAFCNDGPWSSSCIDDFWGYSQVIREPNTSLYSTYGSREFLASYLADTSHNILAHNASNDKAPFHWANNFDDYTSAVAYTEWEAGDRTYLEWAYAYANEGQITGIFAVQTTEQHNRTGRLDLWRR